MNVISNSNLSNAESNLNINNTYDSINDNVSIIDFGENDTSNSEAVLLLSKSQGKGRRKSRGNSHP
jgi:hypothetical protein